MSLAVVHKREEAMRRRWKRGGLVDGEASTRLMLERVWQRPAGIHATVQPERIRVLKQGPSTSIPVSSRYVLLWVQQDVREECNHALEYAISLSNDLRLPLLAAYGLHATFPEASERMVRRTEVPISLSLSLSLSLCGSSVPDIPCVCAVFPTRSPRQFSFLIDGLRDLYQALRIKRGVRFVALQGSPPEVMASLAASAAIVVCDRGYTRICRKWREEVVSRVSCKVIQVETSVVVPVNLASSRTEPSAQSLRPKLKRHFGRFLVPLSGILRPTMPSAAGDSRPDDALLALPPDVEPLTLNLASDTRDLLQQMGLAGSAETSQIRIPAVANMTGGASEAKKRLAEFLDGNFQHYGNGSSNDPSENRTSQLSPYLHFGHISSLHIALASALASESSDSSSSNTTGHNSTAAGASPLEAFLEELLVRRELARNLVTFNPDQYDTLEVLPDWAYQSLMDHSTDIRSETYSFEELEQGCTRDPCWNAGMIRPLRVACSPSWPFS